MIRICMVLEFVYDVHGYGVLCIDLLVELINVC